MFKTWVFVASRLGIPPQVNVMGTLIFVFGALLAVANVLWQRRAARAEGVGLALLGEAKT